MYDFQKIQQQFTECLRSYELENPPEWLNVERFSLYQNHYLGEMSSVLKKNYPVLSSVLDAVDWTILILDFCKQHGVETHFYYEIGDEFLNYLLDEYQGLLKWPCLNELAHFEWMTLSMVRESKIPPSSSSIKDIDFFETVISMSSVAQILGYHFSVNLITSTTPIDTIQESPTIICLYCKHDETVQCLTLTPLQANFLQILKTQPQSLMSVYDQIAGSLPAAEARSLLEEHIVFIDQCLHEGVIYRSERAQESKPIS